MKRKWLAIGIILLFVGMTIAPTINFNTVKAQDTQNYQSSSRGNWLYVGGSGPGNYSKIQDAVENASDGDTVFVFIGTYKEGKITINKSINLIGENRITTIYYGDYELAFVITQNNVNISGFTITYSPDAISIYSNNNTIMDNIFYHCGRGIHFFGDSSYNKISGNIFTYISTAAIRSESGWKEHCSYNEISHNYIYNCGGGLALSNNHFTLITNNNFRNNPAAINDLGGYQNTICNNIFFMNENALYMEGRNNFIKNNNFILNKVDASFKSYFDSFWDSITADKIEWNHNYWNRPRLLPKLIPGLNWYPDSAGYGYDSYKCYNIDWFPASQPNDIII
jgi:parallel beta-helix repeat protein